MTNHTDAELEEIARRLQDGHSAPKVAAAFGALQGGARPRREPLSVRLPPRLYVEGVVIADGEPYRLEVPASRRRPLGRQPHGVAMRFIDCLFDRCRAPLDLVLQEDPENDVPGGRPGAEMLCCGMRTSAPKSYCAYHNARFRSRGEPPLSPREKVPEGG
ncbi:hypothetical protein NKJ26_16085 [Mesorhizobium sp. M0152]|uniref:hypothetical protein n=1 Tax=unclassified Mesorhizobium TaxID=325217 RepID=UPI00333A4D01